MAKPSAREILAMIADSGSAMAELDRIPAEEPRPPKVHADGPRRGTLVLDDNDRAVDPGSPGRTLADLVRAALGEAITSG